MGFVFPNIYLVNPTARRFYIDVNGCGPWPDRVLPYAQHFDFWDIFGSWPQTPEPVDMVYYHNCKSYPDVAVEIAKAVFHAADTGDMHEQIILSTNMNLAGACQAHPRCICMEPVEFMRKCDMLSNPNDYEPERVPVRPQIQGIRMNHIPDAAKQAEVLALLDIGVPPPWPVYVSRWAGIVIDGIDVYQACQGAQYEGYQVVPVVRKQGKVHK